MSSGGAQTTQTSGLDPTMQGILSGLATTGAQVAQQPYNPYQGPMVANLSPLQQQASQGYGDLLNNPAWGQAQNTYSQAQNKDMNPFMDQIGGRVTSQVTDAYNRATAGNRATFNSSGNFGSARNNIAQDGTDKNLATGLADGLGSLYGSEWTNTQNRALQGAQGAQGLASGYGQALGSAMQAGNTQRGYEQQVIDANRGSFNDANNYQMNQLKDFAGLFGQLQGGAPRTTTTTGPGSDPFMQALGAYTIASGGSSGSGKGG